MDLQDRALRLEAARTVEAIQRLGAEICTLAAWFEAQRVEMRRRWWLAHARSFNYGCYGSE